ncbi:MAG: tyrosine-type recombinase/integrase [Planctomycetaceae bacterium]
MSTHPDATLTMREAFEKHYDKSELSEATINLYRFGFVVWEKLTSNPPVGSITNETMAAFRQAALDRGYSPASVNTNWQRYRAILRRCGPPYTGNPWGLSIIPVVPAMKHCREPQKRPRLVSLEDFSKTYVACRHAECPKTGLPPSDFWRGLLVVAFCTGLRRGDLFALDWSQISLADGTMDFTARKTGKADLWPLHPAAVEHLARLQRPGGGKVFRGLYNGGTAGLYQPFYKLQEIAGVKERFGLHDIRRSAASYLEKVAPGLGPEFLQHAQHGVSERFYLNRFDSLREALEKLPLPDGFRAGPKVAGDREEKARAERVKMTQQDFTVPTGPVPQDWKFKFGFFAYRGQWHPMPSGVRLAVLKRLVHNPEPLGWEEIINITKGIQPASKMATVKRVSIIIAEIRSRLRKCLGLNQFTDPIPCVQRIPPAWTLWIPQA